MRAGELLRAWRGRKGLKQTEAARLLNISQACLSDYERGMKSPDVVRALEIAKKTRGAVPIESWAEARRTGTDG